MKSDGREEEASEEEADLADSLLGLSFDCCGYCNCVGSTLVLCECDLSSSSRLKRNLCELADSTGPFPSATAAVFDVAPLREWNLAPLRSDPG